MYIAPQQVAGTVVLGDQRVAVMEEPGCAGCAGGLIQAAERIIAQPRRLRPRGTDQPVLDIVEEGAAPVIGEIAVGIISEARAASQRVLVEAVDRIGPADIVMRRPRIGVVRPRTLSDELNPMRP
jgi:hypothetical protein